MDSGGPAVAADSCVVGSPATDFLNDFSDVVIFETTVGATPAKLKFVKTWCPMCDVYVCICLYVYVLMCVRVCVGICVSLESQMFLEFSKCFCVQCSSFLIPFV